MRETLRAYRTALGFGFRAAPVHATFQLLLGILMALSIPVAAYGGKLLVDAAVAGELGRALAAAGLLAVTAALALVLIFYYVDCAFGVVERAGAHANRQLMRLLGGAHGLAHHERPDYLDQVHRIREERTALARMVNSTAGMLRAGVTLAATAVLLARLHPVLLLLPLFAVLSFWAGKRAKDLDIAAQEATSEPDRLRRHLFEVATAAPSGPELRVFGLAGGLRQQHHQVSDTVLRARNGASWRAAALQSLDGLVAGLAYAGAIGVVLVLAAGGRATPGDVILVVALAAQLSGAVLTGVIYTTAFLRVLTVARRVRVAGRLRRPGAADGHRPGAGAGPAGRRDHAAGGQLRLPRGWPAGARPGQPAPAGRRRGGTGGRERCRQDHPGEAAVRLLPARQWTDPGRRSGPGPVPDRGVAGAAQRRVPGLRLFRAAGAGGDRDRRPAAAGRPAGRDRGAGRCRRLRPAGGAAGRVADPAGRPERFAAAARAGTARGTVTVLVSHRFSTVRMADLIVVLDGGRVREAGSHAELVAAGGLYAELYQLQSRAYQ